MIQPGRNEPCHCGSGKKYKKCCLRAEHESTVPPASGSLPAELQSLLENQDFESMEDLQAALDAATRQRNLRPLDHFDGLSPEQMQQLLADPFAPDGVARFAQPPTDLVFRAELVALFLRIAEAADTEQGLKATAKGNLPQAFVRETVRDHLGEAGYAEQTRYGGINKEEDYLPLNEARLVGEAAGLLRRTKGRFYLTRKGEKEIAEPARLYHHLFQAFTTQYEWEYGDRYGEIPLIQNAFLFTLYLLWKYGDEFRPVSFYQDAFLTAFPALEAQMVGPSPEVIRRFLRSCYSLRTLERFAGFLGLAELRGSMWASEPEREVRATPLLAAFVDFALDTAASEPELPAFPFVIREEPLWDGPSEFDAVYAFLLGPIETGEGPIETIMAVTRDRILPLADGDSPRKALQQIAVHAQSASLYCAPALAEAGRQTGYQVAPIPSWAAAPRANFAVAMGLGRQAPKLDPAIMEELLAASAAFLKSSVWHVLSDSRALQVEVGRSRQRYEGCLMGEGGVEFGLSLYRRPGSISRVAALMEEGAGREEVLRAMTGLAITFDTEPAWAVEAIADACGVGFLPCPVRVRGGRIHLVDSEETRVLTAALRACAQLSPERRVVASTAGSGHRAVTVSVTAPRPDD